MSNRHAAAAEVSCTNQDWASLNAVGKQRADDLILRMQTEQAPQLLGFAVLKMMTEQTYGGVEVGFIHRIGEYLVRG